MEWIGVPATALAVLAILLWNQQQQTQKPPESKDQMSEVLLRWTEEDRMTVRELLNSICVFGRVGSGKTSSSGRLLAQMIVRLHKSGMLVLCAKPGDDLAMWKRIAEGAGRLADAVVIEPGGEWKCNFLDYIVQTGGSPREITRFLTVINETLRSTDTKGGESADFFEREQDRMLYHAVVVLLIATGKVSAPEIQRLLTSAPLNLAQIATPEWRAGFCNQCLKTAFMKPKTTIQAHDFQLASEYFLMELPGMADRTRSSISTGVMGLLFALNSGIVRQMVSMETNVTPDDLFKGKIVVVNFPISEGGDTAAAVNAGWKYLVQRAILKRQCNDDSSVAVVWCDEAAQVVNSYDSIYINQCRSHRGCLVFLSQSLPGYYATLSGEGGKHKIDALMSAFSTKIYHALGDVQTAEMAQKLIGRQLTTFVGSSLPPVNNYYEEMMGRQKVTTSTSEHMEFIVETNVFMNGLRTGGRENGLICDGIVIRSGEPFSHGQNWLLCEFSQQ